MKRFFLYSVCITVLLSATAGGATAQHHYDGDTPTFTSEHRQMLQEHSSHQHYNSFRDPHFHAHAGAMVPEAVELHPLPDTLATRMPQGSHYEYGVVNDRPVIVDHSSRRVIHHFD